MNIFMKTMRPALLALICGILLTLTHQQLKGVILDNQRAYEEKVLRDMAAGDELRATPTAWEIWRDGKRFGHLKAITTNRGYNGNIELFVAYKLNGQIINVRVKRHQETPGIGDKIELSVSDWILGFNGRMVTGDNSLTTLDGITGATITSRAMKAAVQRAVHQEPGP